MYILTDYARVNLQYRCTRRAITAVLLKAPVTCNINNDVETIIYMYNKYNVIRIPL